jgi:hypothetical protein
VELLCDRDPRARFRAGRSGIADDVLACRLSDGDSLVSARGSTFPGGSPYPFVPETAQPHLLTLGNSLDRQNAGARALSTLTFSAAAAAVTKNRL